MEMVNFPTSPSSVVLRLLPLGWAAMAVGCMTTDTMVGEEEGASSSSPPPLVLPLHGGRDESVPWAKRKARPLPPVVPLGGRNERLLR